MAESGLGDNLRALREVRGLSKVQLADAAGISRGSLHTAESQPTSTIKPSTLARILLALAAAQPYSDAESERLVRAGIGRAEIDAANAEARRVRSGRDDLATDNRTLEQRFEMAIGLLTKHGIDADGLIILEALAEQAVARSASGRRDTDDGRRIYTVDGPPITMADGSPAQSATEYEFTDEDAV
jgi:transcriptional regulator with XRE-family HTH domain